MKISVSADMRVNVRGMMDRVRSDKFWTYAAVQWHRLYKDWVPASSMGHLYSNATFAPKEITHHAPYAHYLYEGRVYGPNYPITEGGNTVGYFSQRNRAKKPTGKMLKYSTEFHKKATRKWDLAAKPTQLEKLARELQHAIDTGRL